MTTVLQSLNEGLHAAFAADKRVYLLGEDLLDPYGGAFKVPRGLSSAYPERVLTSPISEQGFTGIATGMALRGLRPVVEIMFGDFITLTFDQLLNSATKYAWMFGDGIEIPLVVRTPMGGHRGYGPTHSQTIEKHFIGIPGLRVLAPCAFGDPGGLLRDTILHTSQPTLFVENKLGYLQKVNDENILAEFEMHSSEGSAPSYTFTLKDAPAPDLTLLTYGYMAAPTLEAAQRLAYEHEVFAEVIVVTELSFPQPGLPTPITSALGKTRKLMTIEEGGYTLGWGAEILARASEASLIVKSARVAAQDLPIPASVPMENEILPDVESILKSALALI